MNWERYKEIEFFDKRLVSRFDSPGWRIDFFLANEDSAQNQYGTG